ncbi:hypothetical protein [Halomonas sp. DQ26W]|uniref:hypothetical protein n=1 Tax=Halomonas sp. DQ26W TaxID=2282311 RepID=UPI0015F0DA5D|nr:hypothetical protein [Halomonas sp. DQ26W]
MNNMTALTLLPQEQLSTAHTHEAGELNRYRRLALSFLPLAPHISRLMAALGVECEQRIQALQNVARQLDLDACVDLKPPMESPFLARSSRHFFVVDEAMSQVVLKEAEEAAEVTCRLFAWLLETNATPELHRPLLAFVTQKNNEYRIIQECREAGGPILRNRVSDSEMADAMK